MIIKSKQLAQALFELSQSDEANLDAKFFDFLEKRGLLSELPSVLYHFEKIMEVEHEKNGMQIEVAHEIKHETAKEIKKYLKAEDLKEVVKIKKELVGGFRAKWGGMIYDASIMTSLKKLQDNINS